MLVELSLLFNKKEGVEELFPEVEGNSHYEKLWNDLDKRELRDFRRFIVLRRLKITNILVP